MTLTFRPLPERPITLLPGLFKKRFDLNRRYMLSLETPNLLQNHYLEAGLWAPMEKPENAHWGWESPTCQIRGEFLGTWLSAAANLVAATGDPEVKGKADYIVSEVARCQQENGGEWAGPIPEKYLDWLARGKKVMAPHCTVYRNMTGLYDMYACTGSGQALEILLKWARWFSRWSAQFSRDQFDDILDIETGGMLEVWANLYGITGEKEHLELVRRYDRRRLFDPLLAGKDVLTNAHANTTVPEIHGAARAWEVTGEERWRSVVEAYWRSAVVERGAYCTGGQTNAEIWSPPQQLSAHLGERNQEHCVVFNMMRLAEYLLRWTGDASYADYWERNLYNGMFAQQHPDTGMVAYYLPMRSGSVKKWGTPTHDFWCCHGTLLQAQTMYTNQIFYEEGDSLVLAQYIPCRFVLNRSGASINVTLSEDPQLEFDRRPANRAYHLEIDCSQPQEFTLAIRLPWWVCGSPEITVNGEPQPAAGTPSTYVRIRRTWGQDKLHIRLPQGLSACPLPDMPGTVAFMEGPLVLAGVLTDSPTPRSVEIVDERTLYSGAPDPTALLTPDNERTPSTWRCGYRTTGQPDNIRFIPLYEIRDERYSVYFPIRNLL